MIKWKIVRSSCCCWGPKKQTLLISAQQWPDEGNILCLPPESLSFSLYRLSHTCAARHRRPKNFAKARQKFKAVWHFDNSDREKKPKVKPLKLCDLFLFDFCQKSDFRFEFKNIFFLLSINLRKTYFDIFIYIFQSVYGQHPREMTALQPCLYLYLCPCLTVCALRVHCRAVAMNI